MWIQKYLVRGDHPLYMIMFFAMIVFFTYFRVDTFTSEEVADNMKKYGGFIPGSGRASRPRTTCPYVLSPHHVAGRAVPRSIALIPLIAFVLIGADQNFPFGGTSILIMVGSRSTR